MPAWSRWWRPVLAFWIALGPPGWAPAAAEAPPEPPWALVERARHTDDLDGMARRGAVRVLVAYNRTQFFLDSSYSPKVPASRRGTAAAGRRLRPAALRMR